MVTTTAPRITKHPKLTPQETEGWAPISPASVKKLKTAEMQLFVLADSMRIHNREDRELLRELSTAIRGIVKEATA